MSLLYSTENLLARSGVSIAVTNENALLPKSYLHDGTGLAFAGSAEVSPFNITVDLGELIPNGDFEDAFTGGVPAAGWDESGGGSYTRNASVPRTGTGCLQASGSINDFAYVDVPMYPGQPFRFTVASRVVVGAGGATSTVVIRDRGTGRTLSSDGVTWTNATDTRFHENNSTSYVVSTATPTVARPESGAPGPTTLRFEFYCDNTGGDTPVYDDVELTLGVNLASIHWHNLACAGQPPTLRSSTDGFSGSDTLEATFTMARPAFYKMLGSTVYRRHWRYCLGNDPANLNGGAIQSIGEAWLGWAVTAARAQDYGWSLEPIFQQIRTRSLHGAEAVYGISSHEQRLLRLAFKPSSAAEFRELRDNLYRATMGGADPIVIVPYDAEDVVIHGRLRPELPHSRELLSRWALPLEVLETAAPTITG